MTLTIAPPAPIRRGINKQSFSPTCWQIITDSKTITPICRTNAIESEHLLASVAKSETLYGEALRKCGITYGEVMTFCTYHKNDSFLPEPFNESRPLSNFSSDARNIVSKALIMAEARNKEPGVRELLETLDGTLEEKKPKSSQIISKILEERALTKGAMWNLIGKLEREALN